MRIFLINITILSLLLLPVTLASAQSKFIVCNPFDGGAQPTDDCDFNDLIELADNIIDWLIVFSTVLAAIVFAFAGFTLITSGGSEDKMKKAKTMLSKTAIGFIVVLGGWLLINTILKVLLKDDTYFLVK